MVIRPAQAVDGPKIVKLITTILAQEFPDDQSAYAADDLKRVVETYKGPQSAFFVAEEGDQIVGTCGVKAENPQVAILRRLFVDSHHRGQGIGAGLLREALVFCRTMGFHEIVIRTSNRMERAIRLCKSLGFQEDGRWTFGKVSLIRFTMRLI